MNLTDVLQTPGKVMQKAWQTGAFREPLMVEMRQLLAGEWAFEGGLNRNDPQ